MNNVASKTTGRSLFAAGVFPLLLVLSQTPADMPNDPLPQEARIETSGAGLGSRVAPGGQLPVAVKLLNFGGGKKVDVSIAYTVSGEDGAVLYSDTETVAVETTASFVKSIPIPVTARPGAYTASASITYRDQVVPAYTKFSFTVEPKLFGLFRRELIRYGLVTALVGLVMGGLGRVLIKRYRTARLTPFDYSGIPHDERVFYELVSDTVLEMRGRVGDVALDIAAGIDGLTIDGQTGRVLQISKSPSKIVALLVAGYEKALGQKVSFSFRPAHPAVK